MKYPITLETNRLILKTPNLDDMPAFLEYLSNNKDFFKVWTPARTENFFHISTQKERLRGRILEMLSESAFHFHIHEKANLKEVVGDMGISNIIRGPFQNCTIGYKIAAEKRKKGFMSEAVERLVRFIFEDLKLHRVEANIIPRNVASIKLIEKLGFEKEGLSKRFLKINGEWEDHFRYAKLVDSNSINQ